MTTLYFRLRRRPSRMPGMNTPPPTPTSRAPAPHAASTPFWRRFCRICALGWLLAAWALQQGVNAMPVPQPGPQAATTERRAFGPLISAPALAAQVARVRILDIRDGAADAAHIPGAVAAPYALWRGPASNPGALLPLPQFTALLRRLGLDATTPVVIVAAGSDASDFGAPARVYWTLKWLGLQHLAILNGGMAAWQAAALPLTRAPTRVAPSLYTPVLDAAVLATRAQVERDLGHAGTLLLDARPRAFYLGQTKAAAATRPGTLPGALDFDNARWFALGGGALPNVAVLQQIARTLPQQRDARQTVSFCNTGHWAATNWFVLSEVLHQPHVALYPGSMVDWSRADAPMAHVPTRLQQLWQQLEQTWQAL